MKRTTLIDLRNAASFVIALFGVALFQGCTSTSTTLRFTGNHEAVAVRNPEKPKEGDRLEALIGTRKKIFLYLTRGASVTSFQSYVDPVPGQRKLVADISIGGHSVRTFVVQLRRPLAITGSPDAQNKALISRDPTVANVLNGAATEIVGTGRGAWVATSNASKRLFLRPIDPDLVVLVDADGLDAARAADFILRMGSLTFEHAR